jgi:hypothetical protein
MGIKTIENDLKYAIRAAGRKAGWATAWRPSPATEAAHVLRARWARCGVVTACSPHGGRRGGTLVDSPVMASRQQGLGLEHHD